MVWTIVRTAIPLITIAICVYVVILTRQARKGFMEAKRRYDILSEKTKKLAAEYERLVQEVTRSKEGP